MIEPPKGNVAFKRNEHSRSYKSSQATGLMLPLCCQSQRATWVGVLARKTGQAALSVQLYSLWEGAGAALMLEKVSEVHLFLAVRIGEEVRHLLLEVFAVEAPPTILMGLEEEELEGMEAVVLVEAVVVVCT